MREDAATFRRPLRRLKSAGIHIIWPSSRMNENEYKPMGVEGMNKLGLESTSLSMNPLQSENSSLFCATLIIHQVPIISHLLTRLLTTTLPPLPAASVNEPHASASDILPIKTGTDNPHLNTLQRRPTAFRIKTEISTVFSRALQDLGPPPFPSLSFSHVGFLWLLERA